MLRDGLPGQRARGVPPSVLVLRVPEALKREPPELRLAWQRESMAPLQVRPRAALATESLRSVSAAN